MWVLFTSTTTRVHVFALHLAHQVA